MAARNVFKGWIWDAERVAEAGRPARRAGPYLMGHWQGTPRELQGGRSLAAVGLPEGVRMAWLDRH